MGPRGVAAQSLAPTTAQSTSRTSQRTVRTLGFELDGARRVTRAAVLSKAAYESVARHRRSGERLLLAMFFGVAEQERRRLVERTRAGIERARAKGTKSGEADREAASSARVDVECARARQPRGGPYAV